MRGYTAHKRSALSLLVLKLFLLVNLILLFFQALFSAETFLQAKQKKIKSRLLASVSFGRTMWVIQRELSNFFLIVTQKLF